MWGFSAKPGTLTHWPAGLVLASPAAGSVAGTLVLDRGDVNLTFKRYLAADLHRLIDAHVAIAERHAAAGDVRTALIERDVWALVGEEAQRQGWTLPETEWRTLLTLDVELNAQGLDVWLDTRGK